MCSVMVPRTARGKLALVVLFAIGITFGINWRSLKPSDPRVEAFAKVTAETRAALARARIDV